MSPLQDRAKRHDHCFYAPTNIAASDDGLGARGYMDPGIASAVAIFASDWALARMHAEDGFLGSANLMLKGEAKVRIVLFCLLLVQNQC